ncbi:MAG: glycoside hydrolase family 3 C-terminal domain-containing protein, partial [Lentisphaerae bacterium]|nr:glycoside hydrolase family 3 C-terminal domain-containing protein [Lentisphaerota bacterium]
GALSDGGGDRADIGLPGRQLDLLEYLPHRGKPVVLVLLSGSPIDVSRFEDRVDAIVYAWYPGEAGGRAIADVLFGDYNPAGRLPVSFVKSKDELPPITDYSMAGRTYRFMTDPPAYHFGHGLSYTTFAYSNPSLDKAAIGPDDSAEVSVDVTNTGARAGDEVVQLYIKDTVASVPVPIVRLAGFTRIGLQPGETRTVTFRIGPESLVCYADDGAPFVEPGEFVLFLGGGQPDDPDAGAVSIVLNVV